MESLKASKTDDLWRQVGDVLKRGGGGERGAILYQSSKQPYVDLIDHFSTGPHPDTSEEWFYEYFKRMKPEVETLLEAQEEFMDDINEKQAIDFSWSSTDQELRLRLSEYRLVFSTLSNEYERRIIYHYEWIGQLDAYQKARRSNTALQNNQHISYIRRVLNNISYNLTSYLEEPKSCYWEDETVKCNYIDNIIAIENMPGNCKPHPLIKQSFGSAMTERTRKFMEANEQRNKESNKDITLFGRVVDEDNNPISNAQISARITSRNENIIKVSQCTRHPELDYTKLIKNINTFSDKAGNFSFKGERGSSVTMRDIKKYGYSLLGLPKEFSYIRPEYETIYDTSENPYRFVMRKHITSEELE